MKISIFTSFILGLTLLAIADGKINLRLFSIDSCQRGDLPLVKEEGTLSIMDFVKLESLLEKTIMPAPNWLSAVCRKVSCVGKMFLLQDCQGAKMVCYAGNACKQPNPKKKIHIESVKMAPELTWFPNDRIM